MVWAIFGTRFLFLLSSFSQSLKRLMSSPFINQLSLFLQWIFLRYLSTSLSRKKSKSSHVPGEPWEHHLGEVWQFFLATQRKERFCVWFFFFGGGVTNILINDQLIDGIWHFQKNCFGIMKARALRNLKSAFVWLDH